MKQNKETKPKPPEPPTKITSGGLELVQAKEARPTGNIAGYFPVSDTAVARAFSHIETPSPIPRFARAPSITTFVEANVGTTQVTAPTPAIQPPEKVLTPAEFQTPVQKERVGIMESQVQDKMLPQ